MPDREEPTQQAASAAGASPVATQVVTGLAKIGMAARHRAWLEGQGLTPAQGQILALLRAHPGRGMRLSEIADAMAVTAPTASVAVQALERKGLLKKIHAADDRRARAITLTAEGEREAQRAAGWTDFLLTAVDALTPAEQEVFVRSLVKMVVTLQERGDIPVARMCVSCRFFRPHVHADPERPHHCAYVDAPFGDRSLRLDCAEHEAAPSDQARSAVNRFVAGG